VSAAQYGMGFFLRAAEASEKLREEQTLALAQTVRMAVWGSDEDFKTMKKQYGH